MPIRAAIKAAAQAWPELFRAHIEAIGHRGGYEDLGCFSPDPPAGSFEAKVQELVAAGKTKGRAIRQAAQNFPELHRDYLARINS